MPKSTKRTKVAEPQILRGWAEIGSYLGIGPAAAQRWAKSGMPVRKEGRFTVADIQEIQRWLGREAHMSAPAHVMSPGADVDTALKESIAAIRQRKKSPNH